MYLLRKISFKHNIKIYTYYKYENIVNKGSLFKDTY